ncbi:MAG: hypothetical protein Q9190_000847 [Brigantiaea leucoxantha]
MPSSNPFNFLRRKSRRENKATDHHSSSAANMFYPAKNPNPFVSTLEPVSSFNSPPPFANPPPTRRPEQPPPYSAVSNRNPVSESVQPPADDPYAFLSTFDTIFLIDDSASMTAEDRWGQTAKALAHIAPICTSYDSDGVDLYFLNHPDNAEFKGIRNSADIQRIFRTVSPRGVTPTGTRLDAIMKPYLRLCEKKGPDNVKPMNIIVITDGIPTDDPEAVIERAAGKLDKMEAAAWQIGIQFFQVGSVPEAAEALRELDDELAGRSNVRDMVDTVPYKGGEGLSADTMLKVVLGAVNRRLDRKRVSLESIRRR